MIVSHGLATSEDPSLHGSPRLYIKKTVADLYLHRFLAWLLVAWLFNLAKRAEAATTAASVVDLLDRSVNPSACCFQLLSYDGCAALHATTVKNNPIVASALVKADADMAVRCRDGMG